ncbi:Cadherin domain-containing protein [Caenorhabditis elegans]|uniref:Cadherin domain-containing protein n=1 Tax=Caenorhabditis elegans TaxID=6239 RepID=Q2V4T5_CAEEL|nr:Cadherin domain-containing protein [Caenorhabditis elegans]CCD68010.1 Cadherin domain-containing protein [Caenorhabditis elegans]|eukprot:NP_001040831.1 Uncharacterized protein CELE_ZK622.5 [Caenorhabditis elegans]
MFNFSHLIIFAVLLFDKVNTLGGKPFHVARRDMTGKNYAVLALCDDSAKGHHINVTLNLRNDAGDTLETIHFRNSKEAIEIEDHAANNITEVVLTADVAPVPYNIQKVSVRIRDNLFKLHVNQECDDEDDFITSTTQQTFWSRRIDCERKDVYCDDRHDEFMGCESVFVYHLSWKRGATGRI